MGTGVLDWTNFEFVYLYIEIYDWIYFIKISPQLTLSTLGKIFSRQHFEVFVLFFPENRIWHFMQIVS